MEFSEHNAINGHYCPVCGGGNIEFPRHYGNEDYPRAMICLDCQARARAIKARKDAEQYPSQRIVGPMVKDASHIIKSLWAQDVVDCHGREYSHDARALAKSERVCAKLIRDGYL